MSGLSDVNSVNAGTVPSTEADVAAAGSAPIRPSRKLLSRVVLLGMLGGLLAVVSSGREWASAVGGRAPMSLKVTASGGDLSGTISVLALVGVAGSLALFATVRLGRQLVGLLLAVSGAGLVAVAIAARHASHVTSLLADKASAKGVGNAISDVTTSSWSYLAIVGGVVIALAGIVTVVRGRDWPGMSSRYEAPDAKRARVAATAREQAGTPKGLWDALDRGEDPTSAA